MKSRLDILEELDIRCGQLGRCRSLLRHTVGKNISKLWAIEFTKYCPRLLPHGCMFFDSLIFIQGIKALMYLYVNTYQICFQVKGVRFCFFAAIFYAIIVYLPRSAGIERPIKKLIYNNNGFGEYRFEFATKDGTFRKEEGGAIIKDGRGYVVRGEYGYKDPEGRQHLVRYIADANGYRPQTNDIRFNDRRII